MTRFRRFVRAYSCHETRNGKDSPVRVHDCVWIACACMRLCVATRDCAHNQHPAPPQRTMNDAKAMRKGMMDAPITAQCASTVRQHTAQQHDRQRGRAIRTHRTRPSIRVPRAHSSRARPRPAAPTAHSSPTSWRTSTGNTPPGARGSLPRTLPGRSTTSSRSLHRTIVRSPAVLRTLLQSTIHMPAVLRLPTAAVQTLEGVAQLAQHLGAALAVGA